MDNSRMRIPFLIAASALLAACASLHPPGETARPLLPTPREQLARGMTEVDAADALRKAKSPNPSMGGAFGWPPTMEEWLGHLRDAQSAFHAVLDRFPDSPEAPEAQFMLGRINDHPYLNRFDDAVAEYRRTQDRYPGTPAAEKALQRVEIIETIRK